ncbi:ExbD/TolR family protein [Arenimonas sp.]|uniref:ExbD/TolR family protein n=1 Tax=Arenimonas sp. TaxID=1872635 RepID=UPI0039E64FC6
MAFTSNSGSGPMADINVTPLVDVMLVLLIIFMVTAPAMSYPTEVDLPQPTVTPPTPPVDPPEPIRIRIDAGGTVSWNGSPTPMSTLQAQFDVEGARGDVGTGTPDASKQPDIEIETDRDAEYEVLAKVLSRAKNAQLAKIKFVNAGE